MGENIRDLYNEIYKNIKPGPGPRIVDMHIDVWRSWAPELGMDSDECPSCKIPWGNCPCEFVRLSSEDS